MVKDLILDQPVDKELKLVKDSDGNKTALELSIDTVRVNNLEVSGTTTGVSVPSSPIIRDVKASGFNYSSTAPTRVFIPLGATTGEFSSLSGANEFRSFVVPYDGYLEQIIIRSEEACGTTTMGLHTSGTGTEIPNSNSQANVAVNISADDTAFKFDFVNNAQPGSDNTFSAGEIIAISFIPQFDSNDTNATIILVYDGVNGV